MECAKIKDVLSEYIDGTLDAQTEALIDEHLLTCPQCTEELASLKTLIRELGSVESFKAPDDFLEKIHERLKPRVSFRKIMHILFVPGRIKIPLEFATATAMAVLIFSILYIRVANQTSISIKGRKATAPYPISFSQTRTMSTSKNRTKYSSLLFRCIRLF